MSQRGQRLFVTPDLPGEDLQHVHDEPIQDVSMPRAQHVKLVEYDQLHVVVGFLDHEIDEARRRG
jgi:hypothetical protein